MAHIDDGPYYEDTIDEENDEDTIDEENDPDPAETEREEDYRQYLQYLQMQKVAEDLDSERWYDGAPRWLTCTRPPYGGLDVIRKVMQPVVDQKVTDPQRYMRAMDGSTSIWWAARYGEVELLEALIQQHAGMVTRYGPGGVTPLMIATLHGHKDAVLRVMPRLPINEVDLGGNTALHYAARAGDAEILGWLLYSGADFSVPNKCGETPLDLAKSFEHEQCVQTLQHWEAMPEMELWAAVASGDVERAQQHVITRATQYAHTKETPLHWASRRKSVAMIKYLLSLGLARDKLDYACRSPLWHAVSLNNEVAVAALLEARAVVSFDCLGKAESAYGEQSTMHRLLMEPLEDRSRRELTLKIQLSMLHLTPGSKLCEEFHALWRNEHGMTDERIKELTKQAKKLGEAELKRRLVMLKEECVPDDGVTKTADAEEEVEEKEEEEGPTATVQEVDSDASPPTREARQDEEDEKEGELDKFLQSIAQEQAEEKRRKNAAKRQKAKERQKLAKAAARSDETEEKDSGSGQGGRSGKARGGAGGGPLEEDDGQRRQRRGESDSRAVEREEGAEAEGEDEEEDDEEQERGGADGKSKKKRKKKKRKSKAAAASVPSEGLLEEEDDDETRHMRGDESYLTRGEQHYSQAVWQGAGDASHFMRDWEEGERQGFDSLLYGINEDDDMCHRLRMEDEDDEDFRRYYDADNKMDGYDAADDWQQQEPKVYPLHDRFGSVMEDLRSRLEEGKGQEPGKQEEEEEGGGRRGRRGSLREENVSGGFARNSLAGFLGSGTSSRKTTNRAGRGYAASME